MKIPLEWLKEYINTNKSAKDLADSFTALGLMLDKPVFTYEKGKYKTEVLDLEHRMDRADWLSILGCARDLAAFENTNLKQPELYSALPKKIESSEKIKIEVQCPDLVYRFNTRIFKNVKVKPSPDWLKNRLESYGIPSINNIVDITNYVMVELGQPMHAQDISKFEKPEIVIRRAKNGEKITTLLGQTIELDTDTFVLTQNDLPTVIGGIVGGVATGIDESTTTIILDAGNYNQTNIRKTSRRLKIQNETVSRYDKFLHPRLSEVAIRRATKLILDLAGGEYCENVDWYPKKWPLKRLILNLERIKTLAGFELQTDYIKNVLTKLEYKILNEDEYRLEVEIPYFRTDVEVQDDIVADLLRMYNYSGIPMERINTAPPKDITPPIYKFEDHIRDICVNLGLHEHITDPLVAANENDTSQVKLENSQSKLKNALRTTMYDGLKNVADTYFKHKISSTKLFEIGKTYSRIGNNNTLDDFVENRITQIYVADANKDLLTNALDTRKILDGIMINLGIEKYSLAKNPENKNDISVEILVNGNFVGTLSWNTIELRNAILIPFSKMVARIVSEYSVTFEDDISVMLPINITAGEIIAAIEKISDEIKEVDAFQQDYSTKDEKLKSVLIKVAHTKEDFVELRNKIVEDLKKLGAEVR